MTVPVGGLRARLIRESLYQMIHGALDDLGWFDAGRQHSPVTFNADPIKDPSKIELNTSALADFDTNDDEAEIGSLMTEITWRFYVDMYAESEALGLHFVRDVKDLLQGRMASIGRTRPDFLVYDYTQATPPALFYCELLDVRVDRPPSMGQLHDRFWYMVRFDVFDTYTDEDG